MTEATPTKPTSKTIPCDEIGSGWTRVVKTTSTGRQYTYCYCSPVKTITRGGSTIGGTSYRYRCFAEKRQERILQESDEASTNRGQWLSTLR